MNLFWRSRVTNFPKCVLVKFPFLNAANSNLTLVSGTLFQTKLSTFSCFLFLCLHKANYSALCCLIWSRHPARIAKRILDQSLEFLLWKDVLLALCSLLKCSLRENYCSILQAISAWCEARTPSKVFLSSKKPKINVPLSIDSPDMVVVHKKVLKYVFAQ